MRTKEGLIIVDYQNDFAHPEWSLYVNGWEKLVDYINNLMWEIKSKAGIIISTQDFHPENHTSFAKNHNVEEYSMYEWERKWPVHCIEKTWWSEFLEWLDQSQIDKKILKGFEQDKECYSWFWGKEIITGKSLEDILQKEKIKILHIVWLATDFCVHATVEDAIKNNYDVQLHTNGIAWVYPTPESHNAIPSMQKMWAKII